MTDPIADFLTRIRNALRVKKTEVTVPYSRLKEALAEILVREGRLERFEHQTRDHGVLRLYLKYGTDGRPAISTLSRISRPGRRSYVGRGAIPTPRFGFGLSILSTPRGVLTDREARKLGIGGEVLCEIV